MESLIAYCGIECGECPAYIALKNDDDELRKKTAVEWSKTYESEIKPEHINCAGCTDSEGPHIIYCDRLCVIRKCAINKKVSSCAECSDYCCDALGGFLKNVPKARERLERLRNKE